jgi:Ca2+-binding RTX toxin-like protein
VSRTLVAIPLAALAVATATLATAAIAGAAGTCNGLAVTVDVALGQQPTAGNDVIMGTAAIDYVYALGGNDVICAGAGDDVVFGQDGNDTMFGEAGVDYLGGGAGTDTFDGGDGNDYVDGGDEGETMNGGGGDDVIFGRGGNDILNGGAGVDYLLGGLGVDAYDGGPDFDYLDGGPEGETMNGGDGDDIVVGLGGNDTLNGGNGADYLLGGDGVDVFNGNDGNDVLDGGIDAETMDGGPGNDAVYGRDGNDTLTGGTGSDFVTGEGGNDSVNGGADVDYCIGGAGIDTIDVSCEGVPLSEVEVTTSEFVTGLTGPRAIAYRPGDTAMYVAECRGTVRRVSAAGVLQAAPVLDIDPLVQCGSERGLLGLAFSADGRTMYLQFTRQDDGDLQLVSQALDASGNPTTAPPREMLRIEHSARGNHNGGDLHFGPDGFLYVTTGDGGGTGDPDQNGQNTSTLLGKILRINPTPAGTQPYTIPAGNPFGTEVWAYGLRNPWRMAFDPATGDMWIGDVGQGQREEIDFDAFPLDAGRNYGWNRREGTLPYNGGASQPGDIEPIHDYGRTTGDCSVTGGRVYRGTSIAGLNGTYVYADYCSGRIGLLRQANGVQTEYEAQTVTNVPDAVAFGQNAAGEVFVANRDSTIYRLVQGPAA